MNDAGNTEEPSGESGKFRIQPMDIKPVKPELSPEFSAGIDPGMHGLIQQDMVDGKLFGCWRDDDLLVVKEEHSLPSICPLIGGGAQDEIKVGFTWFPSWAWLLMFLNWLICLIVIAVMSKRQSVRFHLSEQAITRRRIGKIVHIVGLIMILGGIPAYGFLTTMMFAVAKVPTDIAINILIWGGPILFILSMVVIYIGLRMKMIFRPVRINGKYIWIKGVHPNFLNELPPFSDWDQT